MCIGARLDTMQAQLRAQSHACRVHVHERMRVQVGGGVLQGRPAGLLGSGVGLGVGVMETHLGQPQPINSQHLLGISGLGMAGRGGGLGVGVGVGGSAGGGLTLHGAPLALAPGSVIGEGPFFFFFFRATFFFLTSSSSPPQMAAAVGGLGPCDR